MPELNLKYVPPPQQCFLCADDLTWTIRHGYVHSDGNAIVTYQGDDGETHEDHRVKPVNVGFAQAPRTGRRPGEKEVPRE